MQNLEEEVKIICSQKNILEYNAYDLIKQQIETYKEILNTPAKLLLEDNTTEVSNVYESDDDEDQDY